ncbi:hypothetical protein HDF24_25015 [Mucilaginibacter sp. X4EP1]|uniref:hypothetical protein n=1 Tax=Mucilaginibacter sp. X4EP1 TaxID=2723092 RepID=UPI0021694914|nr:hypothetical protein [Mucilaginibacter sp. X4EP1]MCS3815128.1 hypothetical protein [Mucilaginibacter sp. X4EP1]
MFFNYGSYYYIIIALQVYCAVHSYRRGTLGNWIFFIIFLPLLGSLFYIYREVLSNRGSGSSFKRPIVSTMPVINQKVNIKKLEEQLRFADTFANKINLADAYLASGLTDKAIDLYTTSLTGAFAENEHVMMQLMIAYFEQKRYAEVIPLGKKLYKPPQFARSKAHIAYTISLENLGETEQAENEFKAMKGRYSYFEQRYQYGLFLIRAGREKDARQIFTDMLNEESQLGPVERKANRVWFGKAKEELRNIPEAEQTA